MFSFLANVRMILYKIAVALGSFFFKITFGMFPESMFLSRADKVKLSTDVKIVEEDEDSVTIAKFNEHGVMKDDYFKILSTTDLHLGDDPKLRKKAMQMLANHICDTKPDLVVFTGDMVLSKFQQTDAVQFAKFMEKIGVYWTIVFGNHEAREEKGIFKYLLLKTVSSYKHCLARVGKPELFGYGNYAVNILNGENHIQQTLFFFDSGRDILDVYREEHGVPADMHGYDFLKNNQIEWYKNKIAALRERYGDFKSMMYMHIPLPEYANIISGEGSEWTFNEGVKVLYGKAYESVGCSAFNSGMFDTILECGSTHAVFCGHDHVNDFCAVWQGVYLIYNQCCGYETYTLEEKNGAEERDWPLGVTITRLRSDGSFDLAQRFNSIYLKQVIKEKQEQLAAQNAKKKKKRR